MGLDLLIRDYSVTDFLLQEEIRVLPLKGEKEISRRKGASLREVQKRSLELEILPARYLRNYGTAGFAGQKKLLEAAVAVIGAGGLGGWVIEILARMGIGNLTVIDADVFEDNNLNRQLLSTEDNLGKPKVEAAEKRVGMINGAVNFCGEQVRFTEDNGVTLLRGSSIAVDALDNLPSRFVLEKVTGELGIPLVHGAISGYSGQVMTIFPGDPGFSSIYPAGDSTGKELASSQLGNPAATPPMVASWQAQEVVKIILGEGETLRRRLLFLDAYLGSVESLHLK